MLRHVMLNGMANDADQANPNTTPPGNAAIYPLAEQALEEEVRRLDRLATGIGTVLVTASLFSIAHFFVPAAEQWMDAHIPERLQLAVQAVGSVAFVAENYVFYMKHRVEQKLGGLATLFSQQPPRNEN